MSHGARSLYVALKVRYNTRLQNSVYMSARHGAEELGSSKDYVARWHHELQHYGFIRVIEGKEARLGSDGEGLAAHVRLTEHFASQDTGTPVKHQRATSSAGTAPNFAIRRKNKNRNPSPKLGTVSFLPVWEHASKWTGWAWAKAKLGEAGGLIRHHMPQPRTASEKLREQKEAEGAWAQDFAKT
jgi:hypothetical protein